MNNIAPESEQHPGAIREQSKANAPKDDREPGAARPETEWRSGFEAQNEAGSPRRSPHAGDDLRKRDFGCEEKIENKNGAKYPKNRVAPRFFKGVTGSLCLIENLPLPVHFPRRYSSAGRLASVIRAEAGIQERLALPLAICDWPIAKGDDPSSMDSRFRGNDVLSPTLPKGEGTVGRLLHLSGQAV